MIVPFDIDLVTQYVAWLIICFGLFSSLAHFFPNVKNQALFRKSMYVDMLYWFLTPVLYVYLGGWIIVLAVVVLQGNFLVTQAEGFGFFVNFPIGVQFLISLFITDILQYGTHRFFHGKTLWRFHAIHHAPAELDWLSGVRFHPFNVVIHSTLTGAVVYLLGFSPIVFVVSVPFNILYSAMVHANLNWTFGPLRYVLAGPVFHRWHHTSLAEGGAKNFAPTFPFLDLLFGTFYMPTGKSPQFFGVPSVPKTFFAQLLYPFKK